MSVDKKVYTRVGEDSPHGHIFIETITDLWDDGRRVGKELTNRQVYAPGADLTGADSRVVAVAGETWTPEALQAWADFQASRVGLQ